LPELDENTLIALTDLICGDDGPFRRTAPQLADFFRRAGWASISGYDGDSRRSWTRTQLLKRQHDPEALEQVLKRLVDPREYPSEPECATESLRRLNDLLQPERLYLSLNKDGRPQLHRGTPPDDKAIASLYTATLQYDVNDIVADKDIAALVQQRIDEVNICREHGAGLAAVILLGSLLEGLLLDAAENRTIPETTWAAVQLHRPDSARKWSLAGLIKIAHHLGWIDFDVNKFGDAIKEFRDMVHVNRQRSVMATPPDRDTIDMNRPEFGRDSLLGSGDRLVRSPSSYRVSNSVGGR
jgi:hypothetical protein